jgi:hypothetical protein
LISALPAAVRPGLAALLAQARQDTVFVVQQKPDWQTWIEALAAVATIVVAIGLLTVGVGVIFAALKLRQLTRKVEEQAKKLRVDLAPAIQNVTAVSENVNHLSRTVRADADRLSATVASANDALRRAAVEAERRVGEFNALIGVVQEEAEDLFIGGAAAVRGLKAGAEAFRRYQAGELPPGEEYEEDLGEEDEFEEDDEDADELEIRVTRRDGGRDD